MSASTPTKPACSFRTKLFGPNYDAPPRVPAPFTPIIDSREQRPFTFDRITARADQGHALYDVNPIVRCLNAGDYSAVGFEDRICIERKSGPDLFQSIARGRDRFERELQRLQDQVALSFVVVEMELGALLFDPPSRMNVRSFVGSLTAFMVRFPKTHWLFASNRGEAEVWTFRLLERVVRDHEAAEKSK